MYDNFHRVSEKHEVDLTGTANNPERVLRYTYDDFNQLASHTAAGVKGDGGIKL